MKQSLALIATAVIALAITGCSLVNRTAVLPPHPNQVSVLDGEGYDALLAGHSAIVKAEAAEKSGALPASSVPVINTAVNVYNATQAAWVTYRDAVIGTNDPAGIANDASALTADMSHLSIAIQTLTGLKGK